MASPSLKARLAALREELASELPSADRPRVQPGWGLDLGRRLARRYDELLADVFGIVAGRPVAIAAVGGYGRGAVALRSDLDVRILARDVSEAEAVADAVLYPLWDASFAIGHQVLVLNDVVELARQDLATATSLLDWRHLAGERALSDEVVWRVSGSLFATSELARFAERLGDEVARRHERFGDSLYLLEPDVKNGAGGLRDLDVFRWAAQARYGAAEIETLVRVGALVPREASDLGAAQEQLWQKRHLLHAHAGRRSDRLTFDEQEAIAAALGFGQDADAVERMMSEHYRAARVVSRSMTMMLARIAHTGRRRRKDEDLGDGFRLFDDAVTLADASRLDVEPSLAIRVVQIAAERDKPVHGHLREVVQRWTAEPSWCERLRADATARRLFVDLVAMRRETRLSKGSALRELSELGILLAMIPEFSPVVGRVHHDLYHVYTVDVHSVLAVDRLAALARGELAAQYPLATRLAAEVDEPALVSFATLLHDIGKAIGRRDHSERGAEMARTILARLDFREAEISEACALIQEHLTMYRLATRRDVDDPATAAELVAQVKTREMLRYLYLLTIADVSTTSPTSLTSWKAHLLDELYIATDDALCGAVGEVGRAELLRREVLAYAEGYLDGPDREAELAALPGYLASMPDRYLLAMSAEEAVVHASIVRRHDGPVSAEIVASGHPEAVEICVVAPDRPGLLALIAAALAAARLEVLAANVYTRRTDGDKVQAVDVFWVQSRSEGTAGVVRAMPGLREHLTGLIAGERALPAPGSRPQRKSGPRVDTRVAIDNRGSNEHTIVEVFTEDRPGVLFTIAQALYALGLSIAVAKINTEGARVADVFYVQGEGGKKLEAGRRSAEVKEAILAALGASEEPRPDAAQPA